MNRELQRKGWNEDRFPLNWLKSVFRFFAGILALFALPLRLLRKSRPKLGDRQQGILKKLLFPFFIFYGFTFSLIGNLAELFISWSTSRKLRAIAIAMPAIVFLALFLSVLIYLNNSRHGSLVNTYLLRATKAERAENFETARMYYQKLLQLDHSNQSYEFLIARTFDNADEQNEATRRMRKLLNQPDVAGVVNFWFARKILDWNELQPDQKWKQCLVHLDEFLAEAPNHREGNLLALRANTELADMYGSQGMPRIAIDYLHRAEQVAIRLARISGRSNLALARIQHQIANEYGLLGETILQKTFGSKSLESNKRAIIFLHEQWQTLKKDINTLLLLAESYVFQRDYDSAIRQLDIAMQLDVQGHLHEKLRDVKSNVLSEEAEYYYHQGQDKLAISLEKTDQAILLSPRNQKALEMLARISVACKNEVSLAAKQKLENAIGESVAPFSVHLILGSYAASNNEDQLAVSHLRQALLLNSKATAVLNNLAFVLARQPEPHLREALALISQALKISPENHRFLDTRGNIYLRLNQYELAFRDLELAETKIRNNRQLYENLLFLTEKLGFEEIYQRKYQQRLDLLISSEVSQN